VEKKREGNFTIYICESVARFFFQDILPFIQGTLICELGEKLELHIFPD
jgi:hypothetical protein